MNNQNDFYDTHKEELMSSMFKLDKFLNGPQWKSIVKYGLLNFVCNNFNCISNRYSLKSSQKLRGTRRNILKYRCKKDQMSDHTIPLAPKKFRFQRRNRLNGIKDTIKMDSDEKSISKPECGKDNIDKRYELRNKSQNSFDDDINSNGLKKERKHNVKRSKKITNGYNKLYNDFDEYHNNCIQNGCKRRKTVKTLTKKQVTKKRGKKVRKLYNNSDAYHNNCIQNGCKRRETVTTLTKKLGALTKKRDKKVLKVNVCKNNYQRRKSIKKMLQRNKTLRKCVKRNNATSRRRRIKNGPLNKTHPTPNVSTKNDSQLKKIKFDKKKAMSRMNKNYNYKPKRKTKKVQSETYIIEPSTKKRNRKFLSNSAETIIEPETKSIDKKKSNNVPIVKFFLK